MSQLVFWVPTRKTTLHCCRQFSFISRVQCNTVPCNDVIDVISNATGSYCILKYNVTLCTTNYTIYHASCSCKYKYNLVCAWDNCTKSRVSSRRCTLERAITIDHRKKHEQHTFLLPMAVVRSQEYTTSAVGGSRGVELGLLLHRTRLQIPVEETTSPSQHCPVR